MKQIVECLPLESIRSGKSVTFGSPVLAKRRCVIEVTTTATIRHCFSFKDWDRHGERFLSV
jgi:hypothetical protein